MSYTDDDYNMPVLKQGEQVLRYAHDEFQVWEQVSAGTTLCIAHLRPSNVLDRLPDIASKRVVKWGPSLVFEKRDA